MKIFQQSVMWCNTFAQVKNDFLLSNMEREDVLDFLRPFLEERTDAKVEEKASLRDEMELDSLDFIQLIIACEEEFGIEIPDEDAGTFETVGDVVTYVCAHAG